MINKIIAFSIQHKFITGLFTVALIGIGLYSMLTVKLGSVPDITNNQVQVITLSQNLATEDVEQFVTYPVELAMGNLPGVTEIRSVSRFGLSVVTIVFEDGMGIYKPRQLVQEKLNEVKEAIPDQFGSPSMGPVTTGLGEIYQYTIQPTPGYDTVYSLTDLRTIQDWIVKRQLTLIDGVVEVNAFGGNIRQYEVAVNPQQLHAMGVSITEVYRALGQNNGNTGGAYIEKNKMAHFIRGEGLLRSLDDIKQIVVTNQNGIPVTIGDVAQAVRFGHQPRYGAFTQDGHEGVGGMVLMLKDADPDKTIERVKERMRSIQRSLPRGLEIKPFLEASALIDRTTGTITQNLAEGALIVFFVLVLLLGSIRGGLITASVIPLSLLFAFILMKATGVWANLMSLGAIDFGIIVDGAVIIVEGTVHEITRLLRKGNRSLTRDDMDQLTYNAGSTMMNAAFFGQLIILIVFTPILFLTGVEGKMFRPMAFTFGYAVLGAILLCLTYVPMMCAWLLKPARQPQGWWARIESGVAGISEKLMSGLERVYKPLIRQALALRGWVIGLALGLLVTAGVLFSRMGGEFIPQLDEGDIAMQALIRPGSGLTTSVEVSKKIESSLLQRFPEIKTVVARIGVADIPTDPMPMDVADMFIILEKDKAKWTTGSKETLIEEIKTLLNSELTGVNLVFSQPVELRFNELLTGVREDVAVKLYGDDLELLSQKAAEIAGIISDIPGVGDVSAERVAGLPQMTVRYNRKKMARYGLNVEELNNYVSTAFAGGRAGVIFEGEKRFDMVVRFDSNYRRSIEDLRDAYIELPGGTQVPLKEVADIAYIPGPMQVSRDNTFRRTYVGVNTRGRDVESVVKDIQQALDTRLKLPPGYYITYGGAFENLQRASERLQVVVPVALLLIFILLYFALQSFSQALMIYMAIPLAAIGGVFFLALRGMPFSISAGVGFIVLFGVAVLNGLVLISRFNTLKQEGITAMEQRIVTGTRERLRPILLTAAAAIMGFIPMAFSATAGAEVQRPLATVVIGGLITATLLTLVVLPVLYAIVEGGLPRRRKRGGQKAVLAGLLLVMLMPAATMAQEQADSLPVLSLQQARERALRQYPAIQAAQLEVRSEEALQKTAWDLGNTQVFTGAEEAGNGAAGVYTQIGIQQQQVDLFGIAPRLHAQQQRVALAQKTLTLSALDLQQEVNQAWVAVYTARKTWQVYQRLDTVFKDMERAASIRLEVEETGRLEYLATANRARQVHVRREQAYREYCIALQQFNRWLMSDTLFTVPDIPVTQLDKPALQAPDSLGGHPLLELYRQKTAVAAAAVKERQAALLPKLQGQYGRQKVQSVSGFSTWQVGIQFPLFRGPEQGRLKAARIRQQIAGQELQETRQELKTAYATAVQEFLKWQQSWEYYRDEALPLAKEQQQGAATAFKEGEISYTTFLQNMQDAVQVEMDAWKALGQYLASGYRLEYYQSTTH